MNQISKLERKDIQEVDFDIVRENESDLESTIRQEVFEFIEEPEQILQSDEDHSTPEEILKRMTPRKD